MSFKILKAGLQTTLQDLGRAGYRSLGVAQSGAIDSYSLRLANWLVSKDINSPCLEVYLIGPTIEFQSTMAIAVTGAQFELLLNQQKVESNKTLIVTAGDQLSFGKLKSGARAYIAFSSDLDYQPIMGSYSADTTSGISITSSPIFNDGDTVITGNNNPQPPLKVLPQELRIPYSNHMFLRVTKGIEFDQLSDLSKAQLFENEFKVSANSNRMGVRLEGESLELNKHLEMVSSPIINGTVQLPNSGQPIVTLNEGQTIGGYPRVAQVISADLPLLGQLAPNSILKFYPVDFEKAISINKTKEAFINQVVN